MAPSRAARGGVAGRCTWDGLATCCARAGMPLVLGHARAASPPRRPGDKRAARRLAHRGAAPAYPADLSAGYPAHEGAKERRHRAPRRGRLAASPARPRGPRDPECPSAGRLGQGPQESAGTREGTAGTQRGHAQRTGACAAAAGLVLRAPPASQQSLPTREPPRGGHSRAPRGPATRPSRVFPGPAPHRVREGPLAPRRRARSGSAGRRTAPPGAAGVSGAARPVSRRPGTRRRPQACWPSSCGLGGDRRSGAGREAQGGSRCRGRPRLSAGTALAHGPRSAPPVAADGTRGQRGCAGGATPRRGRSTRRHRPEGPAIRVWGRPGGAPAHGHADSTRGQRRTTLRLHPSGTKGNNLL
jgi:hypothetical protein